MKPSKRLSHDDSARKHVYCTARGHLTITNPLHLYSGEEHKLEFSECDCEATPSTRTGEDEDDGEADSDGGTEPEGDGSQISGIVAP